MNLRTALPYGVLVVGTIFLTFIASLPLGFLLTNTLPDDAFYYFEIARNITLGLGSTFDGVYLTNGYHPLWMLMLIPLWQVFSVGGSFDVAPIYAALLLSVGFAITTAWVLYRLATRYTDSPLVLASVPFVWLTNPFVLYGVLSGLETALTLLLIALCTLLLVRFAEQETTARLAWVGVVGGLMMLARLDTVFYFIAALGWFLIRYRTRGVSRALVVGGIATVVVAPFLVWNFIIFGMLLTSASVTSTMVNYALTVADNGTGFWVIPIAMLYTMVRGIGDVVVQTGAPLIFVPFLGAVAAWFWFGKGAIGTFVRRVPPEWVLGVGFFLHFFVSTVVRMTYRDWYFLPSSLLLALLVGWALAQWHRELRLPLFAWILVPLLMVGHYGITWKMHLEGREQAQANMLLATQWLNEHAPTGAVIGVFNAGVQGYFSVHRVVNLDGLVNNAASEAMQEKRLWAFALHDAGVGYVSDYPLYMSYRYKAFFGADPFASLVEVKEISAVGAHARGEGIHIYTVEN